MHILLVNNSKPDAAFLTPILIETLHLYGCNVGVCSTRDDVIDAMATRHLWDAVILSGSSLNMSASLNTSAISKDLMVLMEFNDIPCLGICFGMQLMAVAYGGTVVRCEALREGVIPFTVTDNPLTPQNGSAYFHHQDMVTECPPGFVVDGLCGDGVIASFHCSTRMRYGVQYHPENSSGAAHETIRFFLRLSQTIQIPVGSESLSKMAYERIALMVGMGRVHKVCERDNLDVTTAMAIWHRFRETYGIPAIMI